MFEIIHPDYFNNLMVQRPHHLLREFAKQGYVSIIHNIREKHKGVTEKEKNYFIYKGIFPPPNKQGKRILWMSYPPLYKNIGRYNGDLLVFDCLDYPGNQFTHWKRGLKQLREMADIIFVTSEKLLEFNKDYREKTYICRNGADFEHFSKAADTSLEIPQDTKNIKKPIVGYIGAVADWIDWRLIRYLAAKNEFSLVFIGPLFRIPRIPVMKNNVFFLGEKQYECLPNYLQLFDVCIIPFRKNSLTGACNPVKMYEYLSAGKPVVATDLDECRVDVVDTCKTYEDFYRCIARYINNAGQTNDIRKRMLFANENSWETRVKFIRSVVEPRLK